MVTLHDESCETLDQLLGYDLRIVQPRHGYRFSLDPLLLADFAGVKKDERVADLGTGCGVLALVLARMEQSCRVTGVELQETMADIACRNIVLNGLADRVEMVADDIGALRSRFPV